MSSITVIGIDLGKSTFHLIGHDQAGREQLRKKLNRTKLIEFLSIMSLLLSQWSLVAVRIG